MAPRLLRREAPDITGVPADAADPASTTEIAVISVETVGTGARPLSVVSRQQRPVFDHGVDPLTAAA